MCEMTDTALRRADAPLYADFPFEDFFFDADFFLATDFFFGADFRLLTAVFLRDAVLFFAVFFVLAAMPGVKSTDSSGRGK